MLEETSEEVISHSVRLPGLLEEVLLVSMWFLMGEVDYPRSVGRRHAITRVEVVGRTRDDTDDTAADVAVFFAANATAALEEIAKKPSATLPTSFCFFDSFLGETSDSSRLLLR